MNLVCLERGGSSILMLALSAGWASAQGTLTALNTGAGVPLVSEVRSLFVDAALVQPRLVFNMGFATDENVALGNFHDSFTVTLQDSNQLFTAVYLTVDASGTTLAPLTPGTIVLDPAGIQTNALAYPSLSPVLLNRSAYTVSAFIPAQFLGRQINVYFDLFDNLDPVASQGWFSGLTLAQVPEPHAWSLLLLAAVVSRSLGRVRK